MRTLDEIKRALLEHRKELKEKYKVKTIGILKDLPKWEQGTPDIDSLVKFERNNKVFLNDILENINYAIEFTKDMDYKEFLKDIMTKDAVSQCFIIIGEASKYLDDDFKEKYNSIPFKKLEEIENNLLYQYWDVDYNLIWKMVKEELPKLKPTIEKILKELYR